jgi:hypothetical protein
MGIVRRPAQHCVDAVDQPVRHRVFELFRFFEAAMDAHAQARRPFEQVNCLQILF